MEKPPGNKLRHHLITCICNTHFKSFDICRQMCFGLAAELQDVRIQTSGQAMPNVLHLLFPYLFVPPHRSRMIVHLRFKMSYVPGYFTSIMIKTNPKLIIKLFFQFITHHISKRGGKYRNDGIIPKRRDRGWISFPLCDPAR